MYTVVFYSYRGGVGRTTALVNVAVDLAVRGRKVLLVDFDLEAPGLPSFALLRPKGDTHPGLVEFIDEYLRSAKPPDITDYVYPARDDVHPARLVGENGGKIWVMPAGRGDDDYWRAFHEIDWKKLYDLQDGFMLFEAIKSQWRQSFQPDYVLVDARAGINDRLGICTRQLPEAVVVLFTPDSPGEAEPDVQPGIQRVLKEVVTESQQSSRPRIKVLTVATKVSDLDGGDVGIHIVQDSENFDDPDDFVVISFDRAATIPHASELLLERQVLANLRPRKRLPRAYRQLANALIQNNCGQDREGAQAFLKELQLHPDRAVAVPAIDLVIPWSDSAGQLDQVIKNFGDDAEVLSQAASCLFLAGRHDNAMSTLDRAIELAPGGDTFLWQRASYGSGQKLGTVALADSILWQRASYRRRLNLPGAVDDLLRLLDAPTRPQSRRLDAAALNREFSARSVRMKSLEIESIEFESWTIPLDTADPLTSGFRGIDPYVASAFQRLKQLDKVQEALQKPRIQQLPPEARQALIADAPITTPFAEQEPLRLIQARKWRAAIILLEARVDRSSSTNLLDLFYLAMAYWGAGNEARATELCCSAREFMLEGNQVESILQEFDSNDIELIPLRSLIFWKAGDSTAAKRFLDRCDELLTAALEADAFYSVWRFQHVELSQFQEDCHSQLQMIKGAAIRPYFLGREPDGA